MLKSTSGVTKRTLKQAYEDLVSPSRADTASLKLRRVPVYKSLAIQMSALAAHWLQLPSRSSLRRAELDTRKKTIQPSQNYISYMAGTT
jgi:hypothetical protein